MTTPTSLPMRTLATTPQEHLDDHDALHALYNLVGGRPVLSTVASGLPAFRVAGDRHYDTATGRDYVMTGAAAGNIEDNFDRADGAITGTTPVGGATYHTQGNAWSVLSNAARSGASTSALTVPQPTGSVTVEAVSSSVGGGVLLNNDRAGWANGYLLMQSAAGTWTMYRNGGSVSGATGVTTGTVASPMTLKLERTDNTIIWYVNGIEQGRVTDSAPINGLYGGLAANQEATLDNLVLTGTGSLAWTDVVPVYLQAILAGTLAVGTNVLPPGLRVPKPTTVRQILGRVGTAPTGAALTFNVERFNSAGASQGIVGTVTIADGATTGSTTGLSVACVAGDSLRVNVTAVGSTVAGSDLSVSVDGW